MVKRRLFLFLIGSMAVRGAWADLTGFVPFSGPLNISLSINNVVIEQPTSGPLSLNTPINELLPNNPQVRVMPSPLSIPWRVECTPAPPGEMFTSNFGLVRYRGQVVANTGPLVATKTGADCSPTKSITESFVLPQSVINLLLRDLFDQTISQVVGTQTLRDSAELTIFRQFESNIVGGAQGQVTIVINGLLEAQVNLTRLVSVSGRIVGNPLVSLSRAGTNLNAVWSAVLEIFGSGGNFTVSSDAVEFVASSGEVLSRTAAPLVRRLPRSVLSRRRSTEEFRESLRVSPSVAQRALQLRAGTIFVSRTFRGGNTQLTARIPLSLGSASAGEFVILSQRLYFPKGESFVLVTPGERLFVVTELNYGGTPRRVSGRWLIARDVGAGRPLFRPVASFNARPDQVASLRSECAELSGQATGPLAVVQPIGLQLVTLCSPLLPTDEEGSFLARFEIDEPSVAFSPPPTIRYAVGPRALDQALPGLPRIIMTAPAAGSRLGPDARFGWVRLAREVRAYRVDCFDNPQANGPAKMGIWTNGEQSAVAMTPLALNRLGDLAAGAVLYCRVVAIGNNGVTMAQSTPTKLTAP